MLPFLLVRVWSIRGTILIEQPRHRRLEPPQYAPTRAHAQVTHCLKPRIQGIVGRQRGKRIPTHRGRSVILAGQFSAKQWRCAHPLPSRECCSYPTPEPLVTMCPVHASEHSPISVCFRGLGHGRRIDGSATSTAIQYLVSSQTIPIVTLVVPNRASSKSSIASVSQSVTNWSASCMNCRCEGISEGRSSRCNRDDCVGLEIAPATGISEIDRQRTYPLPAA